MTKKIDSTKKPKSPFDDWTIESHDTSLGKVDPKDFDLYLDESQEEGSIEGNKLYEKLKNQPILNATVAWYLLAHQELIPDSWKGKYPHFWGTVFRYPHGYRCILCLCFGGDGWCWDVSRLDGDFSVRSPSVVLASSALGTRNLGKTLDSQPFDLASVEIKVGMKRYKLTEVND